MPRPRNVRGAVASDLPTKQSEFLISCVFLTPCRRLGPQELSRSPSAVASEDSKAQVYLFFCLLLSALPPVPQELSRSPSAVVRNNILVGLTDMCIHYTSLVDQHVPRLAACIRDRHELVRRQALALLANLLMKDYVKARGTPFHRWVQL